jgi:hypothetical protein
MHKWTTGSYFLYKLQKGGSGVYRVPTGCYCYIKKATRNVLMHRVPQEAVVIYIWPTGGRGDILIVDRRLFLCI